MPSGVSGIFVFVDPPRASPKSPVGTTARRATRARASGRVRYRANGFAGTSTTRALDIVIDEREGLHGQVVSPLQAQVLHHFREPHDARRHVVQTSVVQ
jgi:hypothetical protein